MVFVAKSIQRDYRNRSNDAPKTGTKFVGAQKTEISISADGDFGEKKKTDTPSKSRRVGRIRGAEIGFEIVGQLVSNLRYADDTALCANSQEEAERLIGKVNSIGKARVTLLKLNVNNTKLLKIGKMQSDARVAVDAEQIEVVEHFNISAHFNQLI